MPRFVPPAAPRCPRCNKMVYQAEQVIGPNGAPYHKSCYTCMECNKRLDSSSLAEHEGQAYCKTCHAKKWGPTGYGYAGGAAFLQPEEPGNEFKSSLQQPRLPVTHTGGSTHSNHSASGSPAGSRLSPSSPAAVSYHNTGGSSSSQTSSPTFARLQRALGGETEEQERERLTPVNATLKKRNSLEVLREQAEASRRAYDEAYAQRSAAHKQQQQYQGSLTPNSTGGTASPHYLAGNGSSSNLSVAGSDVSSAFGSTVANAGSPTPSFSSLSSVTSTQSTTPTSASTLGVSGGVPATKTIFFNQPYRGGRIRSNSNSNNNTSTTSNMPPASVGVGSKFTQPILPQRTAEKKGQQSEEDPESVLAKSRQALSFQTGAGSGAQPPSLPSRNMTGSFSEAKPVTPQPPSSTSSVDNTADESYLQYVPIRLVAKDGENNTKPPSLPARQAMTRQENEQSRDENDDDWDPEDVKEGKRKQAVLQQFYNNKAEKSYAIQQHQTTPPDSEPTTTAPKLSSRGGSVATTVSQLVNEAKQLSVKDRYQPAPVAEPAAGRTKPLTPSSTVRPQFTQQQQQHQSQKPQQQQQPAKPKSSSGAASGPVDDDEWDEDPTPSTYGSKDLGMNYVGRNWS